MIIGVCSFSPQVGKTTCAEYLKDNYNFEHVEMSGEISNFCTKYLGYNGNKHDPKQRKILQDIGQLWKELHPDIWLYHNLAAKLKSLIGENYDPTIYQYIEFKTNVREYGIDSYFPNGVVVAGIRSPHEADAIRELGGKVFLVYRDIENESSKHIVENSLYGYKNFNDVLINDNTINCFYNKIKKLILEKRKTPIHIVECPYTTTEAPSHEKEHPSLKDLRKKYNIDFLEI